MRNLKNKSLEFAIVEELILLMNLKKEFDGGDNEIMKVAELKKVEQRSRTMEEFVQKFKRAVKKSKYERRVLIKEFKWGMNKVIRRKLMQVEHFSRSIKQ